MGVCCSSMNDELPTLSRSDDVLTAYSDGSHISREALDSIISSLRAIEGNKSRLEALDAFKMHRFSLADLDSILACFDGRNAKFEAARRLQKCIVGCEVNSGLLMHHFEHEAYT